ncbi:MAG: DNA starvation/stationary phase protection protein Dps [Vampirovibrionales bacterium]|nr:DNA starvation/stationary phase protection protein Dps [Vampirovibrionales bacterium]
MATKTAPKMTMFPTRHDLSETVRQEVGNFLNQVLATTSDLYSQIKQAHWNVKGKDFIQLHELFDELGEEVSAYVDDVAERVTALGGTAFGTNRMSAEASLIKEYPVEAVEGREHLTALADRYGAYAKILREGIDRMEDLGDKDSADLLTEISRTIDKRLWFIESHLQA